MLDSQQPPSPEILSEFISSESKNETDASALEARSNILPSDSIRRYADELEYLIKRQFADSLEQNRKERAKYAKLTFWLTVSWIFVVLILVFCSGFTFKCERILQLSDTVLITLITTTTINVFAFFILVMQFLFNKEELAALSFLFSPSKKMEEIIK